MCFGYHKYTHLIWSTDKLDIYRKSTVFCMHREIIHCQSQVKPPLNHHMIKIIDIMLKKRSCWLNTRDVFYVRRKVDVMKTAKVNAYIMHIFGKIELLSIHAT